MTYLQRPRRSSPARLGYKADLQSGLLSGFAPMVRMCSVSALSSSSGDQDPLKVPSVDIIHAVELSGTALSLCSSRSPRSREELLPRHPRSVIMQRLWTEFSAIALCKGQVSGTRRSI